MRADFKSGFVTLIGRPNVGKSTLMNYLIGQKIAITSNKPQTTRNRIQTVLTREEGQIVFVDTPGIHKAKNKLGEYMVNVAERTLNEVDVVLWLVEPTTYIGAGEQHIAKQLQKVNTPVILVINKTDSVKKEDILPSIVAYKDLYDFAEIVPVSARNGENTDELIKVVMKYLPYGPQFYDEDTVTDQPERQIVAELIREKALHSLNEEIPHGIAVAIDRMKYRRKIVDIDATFVPKHGNLRRAGLICGLDSTFKNVNYYALGPWENTVDRKDGVVVGRYKTTVDQMADPYVKPQSSGSREGLREVTFTDNNGNGVKIATEGNVSFSALPYTDEDLMRAGHYWEMTKRPYTVLHLDAWMRGIGNASCGQDVNTLPKYCVPNEEMSYKLRISQAGK